MNEEIPSQLSIQAGPTFWELFLGSIVLIRFQRGWAVVHAVFPLAGLFLLLTPLIGYRLGLHEIILALAAFSFTPIITAVGIWASRKRNKLADGPFKYTFDSEGVRTSGSAFDQLIRWPAIPRIRISKRFLFIFIAPTRALCIPLRCLRVPEDIDHLRNIANKRTDFR